MVASDLGRLGPCWPPVTWVVGSTRAVILRLAHHGFWYGGAVIPPNDFYFRHVLAGPARGPADGSGESGGSAAIGDGTSNTISFAETHGRRAPAPRRPAGIRDGTGNTLSFAEKPLRGGAIGRGPAAIRDGSGNTIAFGERSPGGGTGGVRDGSSNTIGFGEQPAREAAARDGAAACDGYAISPGERMRRRVVACLALGAIADGTSNTIGLPEQPAREAARRGTVTDGTSNTIGFAEQPSREAARRGTVADGTSNTVTFGEQPAREAARRTATDGSSNTVGFSEQPAREAARRGTVTDGTSNTVGLSERDFPALALAGYRGPSGWPVATLGRAAAAGRIADALSNTVSPGETGRPRYVCVPVDFGVPCVLSGGSARDPAGSRMTLHAWSCGGRMFDIFHCGNAG